MSYMIDARLVQGYPQLRLIEPDTGKIRFEWDCRQTTQKKDMATGHSGATITDDGAAQAFKQLFRKLMLVSCMDQLSLTERAEMPSFGDECIDCTACIEQVEPLSHNSNPLTVSNSNVLPLFGLKTRQ